MNTRARSASKFCAGNSPKVLKSAIVTSNPPQTRLIKPWSKCQSVCSAHICITSTKHTTRASKKCARMQINHVINYNDLSDFRYLFTRPHCLDTWKRISKRLTLKHCLEATSQLVCVCRKPKMYAIQTRHEYLKNMLNVTWNQFIPKLWSSWIHTYQIYIQWCLIWRPTMTGTVLLFEVIAMVKLCSTN